MTASKSKKRVFVFRENQAIISGELSLNKRDAFCRLRLLIAAHFPAIF